MKPLAPQAAMASAAVLCSAEAADNLPAALRFNTNEINARGRLEALQRASLAQAALMHMLTGRKDSQTSTAPKHTGIVQQLFAGSAKSCRARIDSLALNSMMLYNWISNASAYLRQERYRHHNT